MHFKHSLQGLFLLSLSWIKVKDTNLQKANYSLIRNLVFRILALKSGNIKEVLWKIEGILWKSSSRQTDLGKGDCYPPFTHHSGFIGAASFICCAKKHQERLKEKPICRMIVLFFFLHFIHFQWSLQTKHQQFTSKRLTLISIPFKNWKATADLLSCSAT